MNNWLIAAAGLSFAVGLVHSVMGEQRIFRQLRRSGRMVPTEGGALLREFQVRILWATWHSVSLLIWVLSAAMVWLASPEAAAASNSRIEFVITLAFALAGLLVLISNRGRHPAWVALWAVALLVSLGM